MGKPKRGANSPSSSVTSSTIEPSDLSPLSEATDFPDFAPGRSTRWSVVGKAGAATCRVELRGAAIKAEPDALITMSEHCELGAQLDAGLFKGLIRRKVAGEVLFTETISCEGTGDVVLGAEGVGDIEVVDVASRAVLLQKKTFLGADEAVQIGAGVQTSLTGALMTDTGLFLLRAHGAGSLALASHGTILRYDLAPGEVRAVDPGHVVAWDEQMPMKVRFAGRKNGVVSSLVASASGSGLKWTMCYFTGPGRFWVQTHKAPRKASKTLAEEQSWDYNTETQDWEARRSLVPASETGCHSFCTVQ